MHFFYEKLRSTCTLDLLCMWPVCACSKSELGGGNVRKPQKYTSSQQWQWWPRDFDFDPRGFQDNGILWRRGVKDGADVTGIWGDNDTLSKTPPESFVLFLEKGNFAKTWETKSVYKLPTTKNNMDWELADTKNGRHHIGQLFSICAGLQLFYGKLSSLESFVHRDT